MQYCKKCEKKTETVYNDFMVAFCSECHTMRSQPVSRGPVAFQCIWCGRMMDGHPGQTICSDCAPSEDENVHPHD